jgi:hypothetical protein
MDFIPSKAFAVREPAPMIPLRSGKDSDPRFDRARNEPKGIFSALTSVVIPARIKPFSFMPVPDI